MLKRGDTGAEVDALQKRLRAKGYHVENSRIYDSQTEIAVIEFQGSKGLPKDGKWHPEHWDLII